MNIKKATEAYEAWLGKQLPLLPADLRLKHQRMAESPFPFLRATFYRWAQLWPQVCPELKTAPAVLGVGDLHVENFGTWRDREGRLTWGINDFDEACPLPYPNDLVRLAVSALLAVNENHHTLIELMMRTKRGKTTSFTESGCHHNHLPVYAGTVAFEALVEAVDLIRSKVH